MTHKSATRKSASAVGILALCYLAVVFEGFDMVAYGVALPAMLNDPSWGLTTAKAGAIGSYALIGMLIGAVITGSISDRIGRRWLMIGATSWLSIWSLVCGFAPNIEIFSVARLLVGVGAGALVPLAAALAIEFSPKGKTHTYSAIVWSGFPSGGVLASLIGIFVVDLLGPRAMFVIGAIPVLIFVPFMIRYLPESPSFLLNQGRTEKAYAISDAAGIDHPELPTQGEKVGPRGLFTKNLWIPTLLFGLLSACGLMLTYALNTWLPNMMQDSGYSSDTSLGFLVALNAGAIIIPLFISRLSDRVGPQRITAAVLMAAAIAIFLLSMNVPAWGLIFLAFIGGAGTIGAQVLIYGFAASYYPASSRAAGSAWTASVGRIGGIAGPMIIGMVIAGSNSQFVFYLLAVVAIVAAVTAFSVPRNRNSTPHNKDLSEVLNTDRSSDSFKIETSQDNYTTPSAENIPVQK